MAFYEMVIYKVPHFQSRCTLLVCCEQGQVVEVEPPNQPQIDGGSSYQLDSVKIRHHVVKTGGFKAEKISRKESIITNKGNRVGQQDDDDDANSSGKCLPKNPKTNVPSRPPDVLCGLHSSIEGRCWITMVSILFILSLFTDIKLYIYFRPSGKGFCYLS